MLSPEFSHSSTQWFAYIEITLDLMCNYKEARKLGSDLIIRPAMFLCRSSIQARCRSNRSGRDLSYWLSISAEHCIPAEHGIPLL